MSVNNANAKETLATPDRTHAAGTVSTPESTAYNSDATLRTSDKHEDPKAPPLALHPQDHSLGEKDANSTRSEPLPAKLSQAKKWSLLAIFSLGFFIDIWSYCAFFVFTEPITIDLDVPFAQQSWIIVSGHSLSCRMAYR